MIRPLQNALESGIQYGNLRPEVRLALDGWRASQDEAARLRATSWKFEDPLEQWRRRVAVAPPRGRHWRAALTECTRIVVEANRLHAAIRQCERDARPFLETALARLGRESKPAGPARTIERLGEALRRRQGLLEALDRMLAASRTIARLPRDARPEAVLALLEERHRHLGDAIAARSAAERAERLAFRGAEEDAVAGPAGSRAVPSEAEQLAAVRTWIASLEDEGPCDVERLLPDVEGATEGAAEIASYRAWQEEVAARLDDLERARPEIHGAAGEAPEAAGDELHRIRSAMRNAGEELRRLRSLLSSFRPEYGV